MDPNGGILMEQKQQNRGSYPLSKYMKFKNETI